MRTASVVTLTFLLATVLSVSGKVTEVSQTLFHGEDFHIALHSHNLEVTFRNRSAPRSPVVTLMRHGLVVNNRAKMNPHVSYLLIDSVGEGDEGLYTVKNPEDPENATQITLVVRDCANEQTVKYGANYRIPLLGVTAPISLEYRLSAVEANQTSRPALVLWMTTGKAIEGYMGRIIVSDQHVILKAATGADQGSYTVRDARGVIKKKVCLHVIEHRNFETLLQGEKLKINLMLNSSLVKLYYIPDKDPTPRLLMDKGNFTHAQTDLGFEDRLSMEGSQVILDKVKPSDKGVFEVTDLLEYPVSKIHLQLKRKNGLILEKSGEVKESSVTSLTFCAAHKLESLYVAIIALLGLLVLLLLVCLLSCLIKVNKRSKRSAALEKIAQNAGKEEEGEAFRQVVKNITKLSEDSKHSQADNTEKSQSTEVDIKGLEVSSKEVGMGNLDTSDSGVGFNTALPLDTDTDQIPDSEAVSISVAPETKAPATMEGKPISVAETKAVPETKKTPDHQSINLDVPKSADAKPSPASSPEPKNAVSPGDLKPAASPSLEAKPAALKATSPAAPESNNIPFSPDSVENSMPTSPEPITNCTPEPGPDQADFLGGTS
ncbi:uncharacterized protein si:dkeyp-77h1.4 [Entelurus aequoreus]|uniref:uncharacterized protein si:dkeyp-77h1.4 n=1 Tax=Entelurus aequoreus TaxID=161455 RepID=UPI002B1D6954|nr:uncharacterized protein si:dkeyp-77h1.4 [Entelurus aequoreus]